MSRKITRKNLNAKKKKSYQCYKTKCAKYLEAAKPGLKKIRKTQKECRPRKTLTSYLNCLSKDNNTSWWKEYVDIQKSLRTCEEKECGSEKKAYRNALQSFYK